MKIFCGQLMIIRNMATNAANKWYITKVDIIIELYLQKYRSKTTTALHRQTMRILSRVLGQEVPIKCNVIDKTVLKNPYLLPQPAITSGKHLRNLFLIGLPRRRENKKTSPLATFLSPVVIPTTLENSLDCAAAT